VIAANATSATFAVNTLSTLLVTRTAQISAQYGTTTRSATLTIVP
jgi:hypothetical protein